MSFTSLAPPLAPKTLPIVRDTVRSASGAKRAGSSAALPRPPSGVSRSLHASWPHKIFERVLLLQAAAGPTKATMAIRDTESRVALAMLPLGALLSLASAGGFIAVVVLALDMAIRQPADAQLWLLWCLPAAAAAAWNTRKAIEVMATFDWRVAVPVVLLSAAILAAYPGWWL